MTNYNERLDERLDDLTSFMESIGWEFDENGYTFDDNYINFRTANILRQNITSLMKELVAEAKPLLKERTASTEFTTWDGKTKVVKTFESETDSGFNKAINEFEQNLLKALEEK